jgi:Zn-dependent protease with chaperone function
MASVERIRLIHCPGCRERVIAPPARSSGVWECPFCRRRYRRRIRGSPSNSGTIPAINLFSRHPWPGDDWLAEQSRSIFHPSRWPSLLLGGYAASLLALMVLYHVAMTVLAAAGLLLRIPILLWDAILGSDELSDDEPRPSPWLSPFRTWLPHFRTTDPDSSVGPMLTDLDGPGIFVVVAEIARKVGTPEPDEIRITYLPCCGVLEQRRWCGLRSRRRILVLGLPLLYVLSVEELRAVVAHELAHMSRGDAAMAFVVSQFLDSLDQSVGTGANSRWGWLSPSVIFAWVTRGAFRLLSCPLNRYQEYRADAIAASVCGSDVVTTSLQNAALVQPIFREVLGTYHPIVVHEANLYQFFRLAWTTMEESLKLEMKESMVDDEQREWFGPHPALRSRVRRLERFAAHREPDHRPARRLLKDRLRLEETLHNYIYGMRTQLSIYRPPGERAV